MCSNHKESYNEKTGSFTKEKVSKIMYVLFGYFIPMTPICNGKKNEPFNLSLNTLYEPENHFFLFKFVRCVTLCVFHLR